ncbi:MAG: sulfatase-like hydrolase/transferase [Pseudomonadota bacterium]|nr:sulfatase-like hydrolase/transferase [Pseudomonadota bacterium]
MMKIKKISFYLLVFLGFVLWCYPLFLKTTFGPVSFEQFLFHLVNPIKGTHPKIYLKGIGYAFLLPLFLTIIFCRPSLLLPRKKQKMAQKWELNHFRWVFAWISLVGALGFQVYILKIHQWYDSVTHPTTIFKEHYRVYDPKSVHFTQKKNAIIIYMESMENTYGNGSVFKKNYIPELTQLAQMHTSFNRFYQYPGTQWTMAGVFSSLCGIPLKIPLKGTRLDMFKTFLPGAVCIPEVLSANGYETAMILGTNAEFSGMDNFAKGHGFQRYWGIHEIEREKGTLTPDMMGHGWGLNDAAMFRFAQEKITKAAQTGRPFFFVLETMDTHFPNGFFNPKICTRHEGNMTDAIQCSSKQIDAFVNWIKNQPFASDTAIILLGDHIAMANDVYDKLIKNPERQVMNIFINGVSQNNIKKKRAFGTFDFAPTILAYMGAILPDNSWGLGRSLLATDPTLTETFGFDTVRREIQRYSTEYQNFFRERAP